MKVALLHFFWKPIYPYLVIGRVAVLVAVGLAVIHLDEMSRWLSRASGNVSEKATDYVNRTSVNRTS